MEDTTTGAGGYSRIQHSIGIAADWEKYNPAIRPGELAVVIKADGNVAVKINKTTSDMKYKDIPVIWDQGVAAQLQTNLADAQKAASAATDAKSAAQAYAQRAEATANSIKEKEILAITDSVQLAVNTEDGGLDIIVTTE